MVDFEKFELQVGNDHSKIVKVRRREDNIRKRPNGHNRHDPFENEDKSTASLHFINPTDLEWMSLNYRKERATKISESKRRMILLMFQQDIAYFPTLKEIRDELI